jgi:hypothetical protein
MYNIFLGFLTLQTLTNDTMTYYFKTVTWYEDNKSAEFHKMQKLHRRTMLIYPLSAPLSRCKHNRKAMIKEK